MYKEELLALVSGWSVEQVEIYIEQLEERIKDTHALLSELRVIRKKKQRRKPLDTGARDGR